MSTVAAVIERLRRTWLEPPDYQPASTLLALSISSTDETIEFAPFLIPEDERLVAAGGVLELGSELVRILSYDSPNRTAVVDREQYGTTATDHGYGTFIRLAPSFPRLSIFEAVADNITSLSPDLFTVSQDMVTTVGRSVAPVADNLALDLISVWADRWSQAYDIGGKIVDYHPAAGSRAVVLDREIGGSFWIRYTRRMARPTTELDTLEDLGMEEDWVNIVMAGAAADLYTGRDIPSSLTEWVGATLQAENIPVGTRYQIGSALQTYRDRLHKRASKEMKTEYRPRVRIRSAFE